MLLKEVFLFLLNFKEEARNLLLDLIIYLILSFCF